MNKFFDKKRKNVSKAEVIDSLKTSIDKNEIALDLVNNFLTFDIVNLKDSEKESLAYIKFVLHKVNNLYVESLKNSGVFNYGKIYKQ